MILKFDLVRDFFIDEASSILEEAIINFSTNKSLIFEKTLNLVVRTGNQSYISIISTLFIKHDRFDLFIDLARKVYENKIDISYIQDQFWTIASIRSFDGSIIDKFLSAINKNRVYYIKCMFDIKHYLCLYRYTKYVSSFYSSDLDDILPIIVSCAQNHVYNELMLIIIGNCSDHLDLVFNSSRFDYRMFNNNILFSARANILAIKNYCNYLRSIDINRHIEFEAKYVELSSSEKLLEYVSHIKYASSRLVLEEIIKRNDEAYAVKMIKKFPEYEYLLTLL
jgi:hypothetical protein